MCWSRTPKTAIGLKIKDNGVPGLPGMSAYDRALEVLVEECGRFMDAEKARGALSAATVEWWDRLAPRPSTGELSTVVVYGGFNYSGLTIGNTCKVAWRGKLYRSAFCHELMHIVGREVLNDEDPDHTNGTLWLIDGYACERLRKEDI